MMEIITLFLCVASTLTCVRAQGDANALTVATTELDRLVLLNDTDFVFDFNKSANISGAPGVTTGKGGSTVSATAKTFSALIGHKIAMTVGFIGPCGINLPHTHPRATEINFIVKGSFRAGFIMENGARLIVNNISAGMATVFPQGAVHFEQNIGCSSAMFVAGFNNEDPGVQTTSTVYFGLPPDIAGIGIDESAGQVGSIVEQLVKNPALGVAECRERCGL
jgi:oxalate decarboxylase/phosphoglucose isomerase-like protein (cupin superfamily)